MGRKRRERKQISVIEERAGKRRRRRRETKRASGGRKLKEIWVGPEKFFELAEIFRSGMRRVGEIFKGRRRRRGEKREGQRGWGGTRVGLSERGLNRKKSKPPFRLFGLFGSVFILLRSFLFLGFRVDFFEREEEERRRKRRKNAKEEKQAKKKKKSESGREAGRAREIE